MPVSVRDINVSARTYIEKRCNIQVGLLIEIRITRADKRIQKTPAERACGYRARKIDLINLNQKKKFRFERVDFMNYHTLL